MENPIKYAISFAKAAELTSGAQSETKEFAAEVASALVKNLSLQGFELAKESEEAEQLLIVHAGTTQVPSNMMVGTGLPLTFMDERQSLLWTYNSRLLGYAEAYDDMSTLNGMTFQQIRRQDMVNDMRRPRNYVVVSAFDFKAAKSPKKPPLLWRTHINVESGPIPFAEQVNTLISHGSKHFGRRTPQLIRRFNTEVQIGPIEVVEEDAP